MIQPALESGLFALGGAAIGGVIASWITYRLNERTRRLDLYKTVYPEKFKAAKELLALLQPLAEWVYALVNSYPNLTPDDRQKEASDLFKKIVDLRLQLMADEWLFSPLFVAGVNQFCTNLELSLIDLDGKHLTEAGFNQEGVRRGVQNLYRALAKTARQETHLDLFDKLF